MVGFLNRLFSYDNIVASYQWIIIIFVTNTIVRLLVLAHFRHTIYFFIDFCYKVLVATLDDISRCIIVNKQRSRYIKVLLQYTVRS